MLSACIRHVPRVRFPRLPLFYARISSGVGAAQVSSIQALANLRNLRPGHALTAEQHAAILSPPTCADALSAETSEGGFLESDAPGGIDIPDETEVKAAEAKSPIQRQIEFEMLQLDNTVTQYRDVLRSIILVGRGSSIPISQRLVVEWFGPLARAIDLEQAACMSGKPGEDRRVYGRYLILLPPEKLAVITMHEVLNNILLQGGITKLTQLTIAISNAVQAEISMAKLRYQDRRNWAKLAANKSQAAQLLRRSARSALQEDSWKPHHGAKLGSALISLLVSVARVEVRNDGTLSFEAPMKAQDAGASSDKAACGVLPSVSSSALSRMWEELYGLYDKTASAMAKLKADEAERAGTDTIGDDTDALPRPSQDVDTRVEVDEATGVERVTVPAFRHLYMLREQRYTGVIAINPRMMHLLQASAGQFSRPTHRAMLVPPRPWSGPPAGRITGGYLRQRAPLLRLMSGTKMQMEAVRAVEMPRIYEALTALGSTAWRIHPTVHHVLKEMWARGGGVAELPPRDNVPVPDPPSPEELAALPSPAERSAAYRRYRLAARRALQTNANRHSLRCDLELKLQEAKTYGGGEFYFPWNLDFRGRCYPIPPHLNHMGSDVCRGLLTFAEAKPLGARGLWWLQVHLANLQGRDKLSFEDRVAYVQSHLDDAADSADDPLGGRRWWLEAESPWQALAACCELTAALRSPDPSAHLCSLPVQLDGSCNGLQHYAALGRDEAGGRAVNLIPTEVSPSDPESAKPQDVYSKVLGLVLKRMEVDAALPEPSVDVLRAARGAGDTSVGPWSTLAAETLGTHDGDAAADVTGAHTLGKPPTDAAQDSRPRRTPIDNNAARSVALRRMAAQFLLGHVNRKVIKQTVMTSVYGVTIMGARNQILARLKEKFVAGHAGLGIEELDDKLFACAAYLARTTLDSLGDLFTSADSIKRWLAEIARIVALAEQPVAWITPLGLPVVQPYRRENLMMVRTVLQDVLISDYSEQLPVSANRQRTAFPPNFVHSLDSTHMMMTALACRDAGLTYTAVHDSYWTHACDVDQMAALLREQFIELYSLPLLEDFRTSLQLRFPRLTFPPVPARGTLNLEDVRDSRYFFS